MSQPTCLSFPPHHEFCVLLRHCASVQARCSEQIRAQQAQIASLQAQCIRLRAAVIVRDTQIQGLEQELTQLRDAHPGLARRKALGAQIDKLLHRIQDLMREKLQWQLAQGRKTTRQAAKPTPAEIPKLSQVDAAALADGSPEALSSQLSEADLVICQVGCVSHNDYWRLHNHCRRTGKQCILVDQPDALHIVRVQAVSEDGDTRSAEPGKPPAHIPSEATRELSLFPGAMD